MITLKEVRENKDGSADYEFEYDEEFVAFYKKETGAQVVRKANVGKFILRLLSEAVEEASPRTREKK